MRSARLVAWLVPAIAAVALGGAAVSIASNQPRHGLAEPAIPPPGAPADAAAGVIGAVGLVESAGQEIAIGAHRSGVVVRVDAVAGAAVGAGAPLFVQDEREARAAVAMRAADLARAEAEVAQAEAWLADLEDQRARAERLTVGTSISEDTLARRRFAVRTARAELDVARHAVASARAASAAATVDLELLTVTAPVDGTVLQVNVRAGEHAAAGALATPLVVVGRTEPLHVRVDVDEVDVPRLRPGARAWASVRGDGARRAELRFVRVEPYVVPKRSLTNAGTERVDTRVLRVVYGLDPAELDAFPGQQVDVFIATDGPAALVAAAP
jgi:multidrug efflux pump subunit AcrA (membrane-fusion protein)